jgi:hypothetical protein
MEHPDAFTSASLAEITMAACSKQNPEASIGVPWVFQFDTKVFNSLLIRNTSCSVKVRLATKTQVL